MGIILQPKICLCEGYKNMRPRCSEAFAFAHMGDSSEVFFALPPRLVHWFIRSFEDGINDVDHTRVCRLLFRVSGLVQVSDMEVNLLGYKIVVWSSLMMFDCTAEVAALSLVLARFIPKPIIHGGPHRLPVPRRP